VNIIIQNPFRILGLSVDSKEKEIQKQLTKAKRFAEIGRSVKFDTDFPFLGEIIRDKTIINQASSSIEQPKNKLIQSLFWFWNNNHIDEAAFGKLSSGDTDKAMEIWTKVVKDGDVSEKNFSNLANMKTLYLILGISQNSFNKEYFFQGIDLTGKFLTNPSFQDYISMISGNHFSISTSEVEGKFMELIYKLVGKYLDTSNGIKTAEFLKCFKTFSDDAKQGISDKLTSKPISRIEKEIKLTSEMRRDASINAVSYGNSLFKKTTSDLTLLQNILGKEDLKYQMLANKLANEILQCGIDYFNKITDGNRAKEEDGKNALRLCMYSKSIVCGGQTKTRVQESYEVIREWVDDAPERIKYQAISDDLDYVNGQVNRTITKLKTEHEVLKISFRTDASNLISNTKERLINIKRHLGQTDSGYLNVSSDVAHVAMALLVQYVNSTASYSGVELQTLNTLKSVGYLDMDSIARTKYNENLRTLEIMYNRSSGSSSGGSSGGCYIATMAYGSYDHPQVIILRHFRDNYLSQSYLGRSFIKFYYKHSPAWVERLRDRKTINHIIKIVLDKTIKLFS
jgi:hypothetical protein